jgi:hypothetical protein
LERAGQWQHHRGRETWVSQVSHAFDRARSDRAGSARGFVAEPDVLFKKWVAEHDEDRPLKIVVQIKPEFALISTSWDIVQKEKVKAKKSKTAVASERKAAALADQAAKLDSFEEEIIEANAAFEDRFDWGDRKVMLAASYWTEVHNFSVEQGGTKGSTTAGVIASAESAIVCQTAAEQCCCL